MDYELNLLLGTALDSLTKVAVLLRLNRQTEAVFSPEALAVAMHRKPEEVQLALEQLAEAGLVKRFAVATGRYALYSAREDERLRALIGRLQTCHDERGESWAAVVRRVTGSEEVLNRKRE